MNLETLAQDRERIHLNHASSRPLSEGYEKVGISGELALAKFVGREPDLSLRPGGDGGKDQAVRLLINGKRQLVTVDVKAARKPGNLIVEQGKVDAQVYILGRYDDETEETHLLGWATGVEMKNAPTRDFGYGVVNHYIPRAKIRPMDRLKSMLDCCAWADEYEAHE